MSDSEDFGEPLKKTIPLNMNPYKFKVDQTQDLEQMVVKTSKFFDFEAITEPLERKRSLPEQDKETKRTHWDKEHEETISLLEFTVPKSINTAKGKSQLDELLKPVKEYSRKIDRARQCPVDPLCQNPLKIPYSKGLQQALDRYLDIKSKYERKRIKKEPLTKAAHYFCMYHKAEDSLIPDGLKKGYPLDIKFADISDRIHRMEHRIKRFLDPQHPSLFRSRVLDMYRTHGALKARSNSVIMSRLDDFSCGYYGMRGSDVIFKQLLHLFPDIDAQQTHPQSQTDFLQLVLVPETAALLICEDFEINFETDMDRAYNILNDSTAFGNIVHCHS